MPLSTTWMPLKSSAVWNPTLLPLNWIVRSLRTRRLGPVSSGFSSSNRGPRKSKRRFSGRPLLSVFFDDVDVEVVALPRPAVAVVARRDGAIFFFFFFFFFWLCVRSLGPPPPGGEGFRAGKGGLFFFFFFFFLCVCVLRL